MANWTQQEIEELMAKMTKKAMTDAAFRKELLADATAALEKLAGKPLPEGASLKCVERDPNYQTTLVLPDLLDEEKLDDESLQQVAGGISVAVIVSICFAAGGLGPDVGACTLLACAANACGAQGNADKICAAHACGRDSKDLSEYNICSAEVCASQTCSTEFCSTLN